MIRVTGSVTDFEAAFKVKLSGCKKQGQTYRIRSGEIFIPENLKDVISGVFGLDNRPVARPMYQIAKDNSGQFIAHASSSQSLTAVQVGQLYGFPTNATGKGQCIGIIELGGGYKTADLLTYFKNLGITAPTVKAVSVDGGKNTPTNANSADSEVVLDIEVAGPIANAANIVVYFASNTDQGFLDAITKAIHDTQNKPSVISISWGQAEIGWTQQSLDNFNEAFKTAATLGVTICVASGDSGSRDDQTDGKVHVDFPASSPYVLSCGGTTLIASGTKIASESVWHDSTDSASGGGVSDYFALPSYQASVSVPLAFDSKFKGRGVPDVTGNADPSTGYKVLVDGSQLVIGGTSAVAPLMAGLIAKLNEIQKKPMGFINPLLYGNPALCRDIISGNNKTTTKGTGYNAGPGWDACSGLGVYSGGTSVKKS